MRHRSTLWRRVKLASKRRTRGHGQGARSQPVRLLGKHDHLDLDDHHDHGYGRHPHHGDALGIVWFGWRRAGFAVLVVGFAAATAVLVQVLRGEWTFVI